MQLYLKVCISAFALVILALPTIWGIFQIVSCSVSTGKFAALPNNVTTVFVYNKGKNHTCEIHEILAFTPLELYYNPANHDECCLTKEGDVGLGVLIIGLDVLLCVGSCVGLMTCFIMKKPQDLRQVVQQPSAHQEERRHTERKVEMNTVEISDKSTVQLGRQNTNKEMIIVVQPFSGT